MKAMILAAGRGVRLRPITDDTPKPLVKVGAHPLIVYHLMALAQAQINQVVINVCYQADRIMDTLGDGSQFGVKINYSIEQPNDLGTGGGIAHALPLLGDEPFIVLNADIWTDYPFSQLKQHQFTSVAHLVLFDNPPHVAKGDFYLHDGLASLTSGERLTYTGIGLYQPSLFTGRSGKFQLKSILDKAIPEGRVSAEHFQGSWLDIGTAERLQYLRDLQKTTS